MRNLHAVFHAVDPHLHAVHTFTFGGTHGGSTTPENGFLSPDSLRWSVLDAPMRLGTIDNTTTSTMTRTLQMRLVKVLKILVSPT